VSLGEAAAPLVRVQLAPRTQDILRGQAHGIRPLIWAKIAMVVLLLGIVLGNSGLGLWRVVVVPVVVGLAYFLLFAIPHDHAAKVRKLNVTMTISDAGLELAYAGSTSQIPWAWYREVLVTVQLVILKRADRKEADFFFERRNLSDDDLRHSLTLAERNSVSVRAPSNAAAGAAAGGVS
jgi:hypothetical protein